MTNIIKLVLTDHWFEEIKSGRKTHEYRKCTDFWEKRISALNYSLMSCRGMLFAKEPCFVEFQKAYRKNPERMTFRLEYIAFLKSGINTDLACFEPVFDIKLGERRRYDNGNWYRCRANRANIKGY